MIELRLCPNCGAEIPANSPIGLCPRCLLKAANDSQSAKWEGESKEGEVPAEPGPTKATPPASGFLPPSVEELAPLFPQLEILELLGKGGMGAVYKARQPGLDRLVAVKILPPEISHDLTFAERFQREARALARLSHPHIVAVYDFGQVRSDPIYRGAMTEPGVDRMNAVTTSTGGLYYIVMEFVDGANLRQTIQTGKLTPTEALAIVPQICEALQFAHDEGIVHRDIKPENILIDKRGRVKIADFGLAKLLGQDASDHSLTATHQVMGTLRYMAPEQMQGSREVDHRADIYSLGVVFYELLTGELPMGKFAPPSKRVQVDVRLDEIVLRALEQQPEQRYQHVSELKTDVEHVTSGLMFAVVQSPQPASRSVQIEAARQRSCEPLVSRFAIVGAVWAFFGVIAFIPIGYFIMLSRVWNGTALPTDLIHEQPPLAMTIFMGVLLTTGVGSPIVTPTFGALAIRHIKRSGGSIIGLSLAVADVLIVPLLIVGFGVFALTHLAQIAIWTEAHTQYFYKNGVLSGYLAPNETLRPNKMFRVLDTLAVLLVCILIARLAWRVIARHMRSENAIEPNQVSFPSTPSNLLRPKLVSVVATFNLLSAIGLMLANSGPVPPPFPESTPAIWRTWGLVSSVLGSIMAAGLFASSIGLYLWQSWARKLLIGVCIYGLASLVIDMPYLAQAVIPHTIADMRRSLAADRYTAEDQDLLAPLIFGGFFLGILGIALPSLIGQLVYFTRPKVVAAFKRNHIEKREGDTPAEPRAAEKYGLAGASPSRYPTPQVVTESISQESLPYLLGWLTGWLLLERWFVMILRTATALIYAACLIAFFSFQSTNTQSLDGSVTKFLVGQPSAWLTLESSRSGQHARFEFITLTHFVALFGLASLAVCRWLERRHSGNAHSMVWHYVTWVLFFAGASGAGLMVMADSTQRRMTLMTSTNQFEPLPSLNSIANGIGAEFTIPAGHVATFEIVTRRDNETVPLPSHGAYLMAAENKPITGQFRWTWIRDEVISGNRSSKWRIEMFVAGGSLGHSEPGHLLAVYKEMVGTRPLTLGLLEPNEEVTHWGTADANNLPANGLIGLRVAVVPHGLKLSHGSGFGSIDWKKTQTTQSTTRRKLP